MPDRPAWQADPARYPYRPGSLFLGVDNNTKREVGISTERHAIAVASSRTGKGASLLIPNLLRWPGSALNVDPKGENADATAEHRANIGQTVGVLDPYRASHVPDALRCSINPLALVDPSSLRARVDLEAIADGFIRRFDPKHGQWDEAGTGIGAGLMAYVLETAPPEFRTMSSVRRLMMQTDEGLRETTAAMLTTEAMGGLAKDAAISILRALTSPDSVEAGGFGRLKKETSWMDDKAMASILTGNNPFPLETLKNGTGTLYLVIPGDILAERSGFLRLFVRIALMVMARTLNKPPQPGQPPPPRCLFLLDEFYSLGRIDLIATAAGQMPGFGVTLFPFVQELGQLRDLYGSNLSETFFSNADAAIFFGVSDSITAEYVSRRIGAVQPHEIGEAPTMGSGINPITGATVGAMLGSTGQPYSRTTGAVVGGMVGMMGSAIHDAQTRATQHKMNQYQQRAMTVGRPRISPEEVQFYTGKPDGASVAQAMIAFVKAGDVLGLRLAPYFDETLRKFTELRTRIDNRKAAEALNRWPRLKLNILDGLAGLTGFLLLGSAAGPIFDSKTVPAETWSFLYATWGVLTAALVGLLTLRKKIAKP